MLPHLKDFSFKSSGIFTKAAGAKRKATQRKAYFVKYPTNMEQLFYPWVPHNQHFHKWQMGRTKVKSTT